MHKDWCCGNYNGKESEIYFHSAVQIQDQRAGGKSGNAEFIWLLILCFIIGDLF